MRPLALGVLLGMALSAAFPALALAHPLGNFTVNRYSRIEVARDGATLRYVLDLAEIPTLQELNAAGLDPQASAAVVRERLLAEKSAQLAAGARLVLDDRAVPWTIHERSLDLIDGQAGLRTLRIELMLASPISIADGVVLRYRDTSYPDRIGWHEVVVRGREGVVLDASTVPDRDASDELRSYPVDPARPPLDVSAAQAIVRHGVTAANDPGTPFAREAARPFGVDVASERMTAFVRDASSGDVPALVAALLLAAGIGAFHALTPGHGKTVMAAYLIGARGARRQAALLGAVVAVSHTLGVLGLAALVLGAGSVIAPERLYPLLSTVSALTITGIGVWLLWGRWRERAHAHAHARGLAHDHAHPVVEGLGWRPLLALGLSGGIVPSASALLILLAAVTLRRPDLGIVLVVAFGAGMAAVLVGLGLALVSAGRVGSRWLRSRPLAARWRSLLPTVTAAIVLLVGATLSVQAIGQVLALAG